MYWYLEPLRKYAVFSGRAQRKEYWIFLLFNLIIVIVLLLVDHKGWIGRFFGIALCVPSLAVAVRRLHDTGRRGSWILISLVPIIGPIALLVFLATDSQPGENQYGPNPKGINDGLKEMALHTIDKAKGIRNEP